MPGTADRQDTEPVSQNNLGQEFREETEALMARLQDSLAEVICGTDDRMALPPGAEAALVGFYEPLPETGNGAAALKQANQLDPIVLYWSAVANSSIGNTDKAKDLAPRAAYRNTLSPNLPFFRVQAIQLLEELEKPEAD